MEYNTQQRKLPLPEYGRSVQNMVDHALTIEDREERQRCANTIVNIMGGMFPQLRDMEDFRHKLWDHLAIMSDFKLDIDYPVEIVKKESLEVKPDRIPYSPNVIRFRHYGRFIQDLIKIAVDYPEGDEKKQLIKYNMSVFSYSYKFIKLESNIHTKYKGTRVRIGTHIHAWTKPLECKAVHFRVISRIIGDDKGILYRSIY